jgi:4-hydroxy-tetrahydrodipicolinate reductase
MIKICVSGSKGKMGSRILALAKDDKQFAISGEFDVGAEPEPFIKECDCLIEFTTPRATIEHVALCEKHAKAIVIGTTGLSEAEQAKVKEASKNIAIVLSPNMSIAVNLLFKMASDASRVLGGA